MFRDAAIGRAVRRWAALLLFLGAAIAALAASVTLAWDPNSEADVAGYRLFWGTTDVGFVNVTNCGNVTNWTVVDLQPAEEYAFYVTCYNTSGLESEPSNVVTYSVPGLLPAPTLRLR
jgi:chitinase